MRKLPILNSPRLLTAVTLTAVLVAVGAILLNKGWDSTFILKDKPPLDELSAYFPFGFSDTLDPRKIVTVGDQVLAEHVFAFHASQNKRQGFVPVFSKVAFNHEESTIEISPLQKVYTSDGRALPLSLICNELKESFQGTQHAEYKDLFISAECAEDNIRIRLKKIPSNMKALFSLPDFAIYESDKLPISSKAIQPTTGPYQVVSIGSAHVVLKPNHFYPKKLIANAVEQVSLNFYKPAELPTFIESCKPGKQNIIYLIGASTTEGQVQDLRNLGYNIEMNPSEWLGHLGFHDSVSLRDRIIIGSAIDSIRHEIENASPLGQPAYSVPPSDRPYGIDFSSYTQAVQQLRKQSGDGRLSRGLVVGTMDFLSKLPFVRATLDGLKAQLGNQIEIKILDRKDYDKLFSREVDVYLSVQGISAADPTHHLTFFLKSDPVFKEAISMNEVTSLAMLDSAEQFAKTARALELKLLEKRVIVPLIHFPGIVASAPFLERDDSLAGSWGIRAWTYRIR